MTHYFFHPKKDIIFTVVLQKICKPTFIPTLSHFHILWLIFFHFFVREIQKIEAAAPVIITQVTTLSIREAFLFTAFFPELKIIARNYESILLIVIFCISNRIFGTWITSKLFSITARIFEKSMFSPKITLRKNFPQKHSEFFISIEYS